MATGTLLSRYSTFGIGGPAKRLVVVRSIDEMVRVIRTCCATKDRFCVIGKGSNTLFDDRGFDGTVLINRIEHFRQDGPRFVAGSGMSFPVLGIRAAKAGYGGLEFAAGIPGSVGGAVVMNAGADGAQTADFLESVEVLDATGALRCLPRSALQFGYRTSPFQEAAHTVLQATFVLRPCLAARSRQVEMVMRRKQSQPLCDKSAGCIFRNPPHQAAGALIEQCGLKGTKHGGAQVSSVHANFIVNTGEASASDVLALIGQMQSVVEDKTGIRLQHEVRFVPYG